MADRTVTVRLRVDDQFSQPVNAYTQKMNQAERATQQAATSASRAQTSFRGMGTALQGAVIGFGIAGVVHLGEQLYSAGMNAQRAGMLFESFGEQVGSTSALLERLRVTTRGVVDDTTLMQAASTQLSMGLARNADDVERLTNIGVTFAQAMGQDVRSSMENLNLLLANQSYLRLDTLGISSSQVRELATGYRAAGMDSAEAFTAAFLEVAEQKLPQMAQVADATVTEFQKLSAAMDNWWSDFGERFAQGVNGLIGMVTHLGEVANFVMAGLPGGDASGNVPLVNNGPTVGIVNGEMYRQFFQMQMNAGNYALATPYQMSAFDLTGYSRAVAPNYRDLLGGRGAASGDFESAQMMNDRAAMIAANVATVTALRAAGLSGVGSGNDRFSGLGSVMAEMLNRDYGQIGSLGGKPLYSAEGVANLNAAADRMERIAEDAAAMENSFTDMQLESLQNAAEYMRGIANDAESTRDAMANWSLSQLFGQTSGGRLGEIDAAVIDSLRAGGASEDTISALMRAMGLDSGQLTQMSVQFDEQVVPFLEDVASQMGADAYNAMRRRYDEAVAGAAMTNTPTIDMASLMGGFAYYPSGGGPAGSYTVRPGDTASGIAAQFGIGVSDFGLSNPSLILPGQQLTWGSAGGGGLINTDFDMLEQSMMQAETSVANAAESASTIADEMTTAVDTLASGVEGVFSKTYQLPIELVVSGAGILGQLIAAAVQANGGVAPGTSNYNSRGGGSGSRNDGTYARGR